MNFQGFVDEGGKKYIKAFLMLEVNGILILQIHQTFFSRSSRAFSVEVREVTISIIPNELGDICCFGHMVCNFLMKGNFFACKNSKYNQ